MNQKPNPANPAHCLGCRWWSMMYLDTTLHYCILEYGEKTISVNRRRPKACKEKYGANSMG